MTNRRYLVGIRAAVFLSGALLFADRGSAEPRAAPPPRAAEAVITPDADEWLERLPGRYRFDGSIHHEEVVAEPDRDEVDEVTQLTVRKYTPWHLNTWSQPVEGKGDCVDIGNSAGVQCVINVIWPELWRPTGKAQLGGASDLNPAMILAGLAPSTGGIRFLLVDSRGLAHPGSSTLSGDAASTRPPCVNTPGVQRCSQIVTLTAKDDARTLFLVVSTSAYFQRNKTDRKPFLEKIDPNNPNSPTERPTEWVEELLDVSFSLRREPQATEAPPTMLLRGLMPPAPQ